MKSPHECTGMDDVREAIDAIDQQVIQLLGERRHYVEAAAKFKTDAASVQAPERFKAMLQQRRIWAEANGLSADVIEKIYTDLVNYFIAEEMATWENRIKGVKSSIIYILMRITI
ncbi:isochorismate lyase [Candidatus Entotheonella palauensis]|uniref:isochorismate lyase n=1 Tax=Candidatus Entotheonella palauensis TaxID=93172 RepID=UPI000B7F9D36|nr:isochorismate lyase [Candidatus Entotheonella palauensis]